MDKREVWGMRKMKGEWREMAEDEKERVWSGTEC